MWKRLLCSVSLACVSFGIWAASDDANPYPSKPIRLLDGFPAGGAADFIARVVGPKLTERFGQTVIVDNRPGAASNIAAEITARANADGYTLMMASVAGLASSRTLYPKLTFDLAKDFSFISRVANTVQVLVAHPSIPAKTVSELVAFARSKPKAVRYGSAGVASTPHLSMELLQSRTGIELLHVAYKGAAPNTIALTSGEVQIGFATISAAMPMITAKRLNALAVSGAKRLAVLPDVPTVAESGVPGFDVTNTFALIGPARIPASVVKLLNTEIRKIVQMDDVKAKLAEQGMEAARSTPEELRAIVTREISQWARVIKDAQITAN